MFWVDLLRKSSRYKEVELINKFVRKGESLRGEDLTLQSVVFPFQFNL